MKSIIWTLSFLTIFISANSYAQSTQKFNDSIVAYPELKGLATYDYIIRNNEEVKNGKFTYFFNSQDTLNEEYTNKIRVNGNYRQNFKSDNWQFIHKRFKPTSIPIVDGYSVIHKSAGVEHLVDVPFKNGIATGEGSVITNQIKNSELHKNLFSASANFDKNYFVGEFEAKSDSLRITGEIDENGLFTNTWIFEHNRNNEIIVEKRYYEKGVLVNHEIIRQDVTYEIEHIGLSKNPDDDGEWLTINANKDYFNIILRANIGKKAEGRSTELTDAIIENSNLFLKHSLISFREFNHIDIWKINEDNTHIYLPKLRVRKFPYTVEEKALISTATKQINESKQIINQYLKDPQVELNKHAYRELALYYEVYVEYIDELKKLEKVFELLNFPSYEFINREEIMPYIFEGIEYPEIVTFTYKDKTSEEKIRFPKNVSVEEATIQVLANHASEMLAMLKEKLEVVEPIIDRNRKRFEIEDKEKLLLLKRDSVKILFTNQLDDENFNSFHTRFASQFVSKSEEVFVNYAKLDIEDRIELTDNALSCMQHLINSYNQFTQLEYKIERLEEVYTRVVWNPFTFTDMHEIVKERVYNAYKKDLLPFLLDGLEEINSCEQIAAKMDNFKLVYERMRELRDQDTKEIERELRRVHDPVKISSTLSMKLELD